jgi:hypothetical protein
MEIFYSLKEKRQEVFSIPRQHFLTAIPPHTDEQRV